MTYPPPKCGKCTACCEWGDDPGLRVRLTEADLAAGYAMAVPYGPHEYIMAAKDNGDCYHLTEEGCGIYDHRPEYCRTYDCRNVLDIVLADADNKLLRVLAAAIELKIKAKYEH